MTILSIETSCDETAAAIVEDGTKIISNVVASSQAMHAKYGGIIPDQAAREQLKSILPVIEESLNASRLTLNALDAIAVTVGPGLIGSLLVGVETAKSLSLAWSKPIVPVNHLVGHIYANWLGIQTTDYGLPTTTKTAVDSSQWTVDRLPKFPALVLLVSGGHTELILMKGHGKFKLLGSTRDDAAGECFDKCARILNLGYPGGPAVEIAALKIKNEKLKMKNSLPRPMINDKNFDFSFSGLKTAVANKLKKNSSLAKEEFFSNALAYELQESISDVLVAKTLRAAEKFHPKSILLAGGVAANKHLREKMKFEIRNSKFEIEFYVPDIKLCTDNAAYIASAAYFNYHPEPINKINADPGLDL